MRNVENHAFLRKIEIIFGRPIKNSELGFENGGTDEYRQASERIFSEILSLGGYSNPTEEITDNGDAT